MIRGQSVRTGEFLALLVVVIIAAGGAISCDAQPDPPRTFPSSPGGASTTPVDVPITAEGTQPQAGLAPAQESAKPRLEHHAILTEEGRAAKERANRGEVANTTKPAGSLVSISAPPPAQRSAATEPSGPKTLGAPALHWAASPEASAAAQGAQPLEASQAPGAALASGPINTISFDGLNQSAAVNAGPPPDSTIAVGPNNIVVMVNDAIQVYSKSGTPQGGATDLRSMVRKLSGSTTFSDFSFDPWAVYDPYTNRFWLMFESENDDTTAKPGNRSQFHILLSNSSDANDGFKLFSFDARVDASTTTNNWCDHAKLGFDTENIYVTCNMFAFPGATAPAGKTPGTFQYVKIRSMDKDQFFNGSCCTWGDFTNTNLFTVQPARMYGATAAAGMFMVEADGRGGSGSNFQVLHSPASPAGTWTIVNKPVGFYGAPPDAREGTSTKVINTGDTRLEFAIWKGGHLTTGQNLACSNGACVAMTELDVLTFPTIGILNDFSVAGGGDFDYYYPHIDINAADYRVMVATRSGKSEFPGVRMIGIRPAGDCRNCTDFDTSLQPGAATYNQPDSSGTSRWGDYSGASSDPDGQGIWLYGEYAASGNQWATRIGLSQVAGPPSNDDFKNKINISNALPQSVTLADTTHATVELSENATLCDGTPGFVKKTAWYRFTAPPGVTSVNLDTFAGNFDTVLSVFDGISGPKNLPRLACNDDANVPSGPLTHGRQSLLTDVKVTPGHLYSIQVGAFASSAGGSLGLRLSPGFKASPATVAAGGTVTVSWNGISSPSPADFIGLFSPSQVLQVDFLNLNCAKTTPTTTPPASGSCSFPVPSNLVPGTYEFRLNGLFTQIATSNAIAITAPGPALAASPLTLAPNATLTATWNGIASPTERDWVGLYAPGADNKTRIIWNYVSCSKTPGASLAAGTCPFTIPNDLVPGEYELRLYADDSFAALLATSGHVTVTQATAPPPLSVSPASAQAGDHVTATWSGIVEPMPTDWLGLYRLGTPDTASIGRVYVSCTSTPGAARESGSCSVELPSALAVDTYELRLFAADSMTRLSISNPLVVTLGSLATAESGGSE